MEAEISKREEAKEMGKGRKQNDGVAWEMVVSNYD